MNILLVTNSARGEAIAEALMRSRHKPELIAASTVRSPGLVRMCKEVHVLDVTDFNALIDLARKSKPDFAFIAPDNPIGAGLADELESIGIPSVAPQKNLARIEASKAFTRQLMKKYDIDASPKWRAFTKPNHEEMNNYITQDLQQEYVVKYDALKGGKGVKVSGEHLRTVDEGIEYAEECIAECGRVVIEEKLIGVEFSLMSFVSGETSIDMPAVQDHKRAYEGDTGPNTGGMGTYSDSDHSLPFLTKADLKQASDCNRRVAEALLKECGEPYRGILYGGFMATKNGVNVIEYNARFGDPEALNVLPLLESDLVEICWAIIKGTLTNDLVRFSRKATVCKYITPKSYPEAKNEKGETVRVPKEIPLDARLYYGDVSLDTSENILLGGSRSIGVVGISSTLDEAENIAQEICSKIEGPVRFRADIGKKLSIQKHVDFLQKHRITL